MPSVLGGTRDFEKLKDLSLDDYRKHLTTARRMGGLTGFAAGTGAAGNPLARAQLQQYEIIIDAMLPEERRDPATFDVAARRRVAGVTGTSEEAVDDCLARYQWMRSMLARLAERQAEGKPMPSTVEEAERLFGSWRAFKQHQPLAVASSANSGQYLVPSDAVGPKGQRCGLAGMRVGGNAQCQLTRKKYKHCCGKTVVKQR